jgi:cytidylate kinase
MAGKYQRAVACTRPWPIFGLHRLRRFPTFSAVTLKQYNLTKFRDKVIAIDGPAGSGKSTTARILAARLGYRYLDTGAMYRALTWLALHNGIAPSDGEKLRVLAENVSIEFETHEDTNKVFINGQEVTDQIRTPVVTATVSEVSAHRGVRAAMVKKQQEMGKQGSIVAEGRDTTTIVFPGADVKVYLDADVKTRAERRLIDLARMGVTTTFDELVADIERRDAYDSGRKHSPLKKARDAYVVDTTHMTIDEQIERILALLKSVMK